MSQEVTLLEIERSKVFVSPKASTIKFDHPIKYIEPAMQKLEGLGGEFNFKVIVGSHNRDAEEDRDGLKLNGEENISYSRLAMHYRLGSEHSIALDGIPVFDNLDSEIGFLMALDTGNPELRAFSGKRVTVCTNQCIFGANKITSINLLKSDPLAVYESIARFADNLAADRQLYLDTAVRLHENRLAGKDVYQRIGHIAWEGKRNAKLGIQVVTDMLGLLQAPGSRYSLNEDGSTTDWILYNSLTESLKKSNIMDEANKVKMLESIFA